MATLVFGHIVIQYLFSNVKGTARCKAICTTTCGLILTPIVQIHLESVSTVIFGIVFNWISTEEEKTTNHFFLKDYDQFKEQDDAYHRDKSQQIPVVSSYSISVSSSACFLSSTLFPLFYGVVVVACLLGCLLACVACRLIPRSPSVSRCMVPTGYYPYACPGGFYRLSTKNGGSKRRKGKNIWRKSLGNQ